LSNIKVLKGRDSVLFGMPSLERKSHGPAGMFSSRPSNDEIERDAYEKGFSAGERAGLEMGAQKSDLLLTKIERIIRELEEFKVQILSELEPRHC